MGKKMEGKSYKISYTTPIVSPKESIEVLFNIHLGYSKLTFICHY